MKAAASDRETQFRTLYRESYLDVLRFVQRRLHSANAEDVVAETFLVVWRRLDDVPKGRGDQRAWVFGIARRCLMNSVRGGRRRSALAVRIRETIAHASSAADRLDDDIAARVDIVVAWRRLNASEQEVLGLHVFECLSSRQAALTLGIPAASYRVRLLRARRALRRLLASDEPLLYPETETR